MKKRILIVDDNEDLRRVIKIYFSEAGYDIFEAANIKDALKTCSGEQPHLILLDFYLTGEFGLDIAHTIADDPAYYGCPKIIGISGTIGGEMVKSEDFRKQNKIDCFIKKPFDFNELINKVKQILKD